MARKPKTQRVARTRAGGQWTEAAFWGFLRSNLRYASRKWPPRKDALKVGRRPYHGPNKRQKWEHQCEACGGWFMAKYIEVDHVEPCGKLASFDDVAPFIERLFCEPEKLRKLCLECHRTRTNSMPTERK